MFKELKIKGYNGQHRRFC